MTTGMRSGSGGGWRHGGVSWWLGVRRDGDLTGRQATIASLWRPRRSGPTVEERARPCRQRDESSGPGPRARRTGRGLLPDGFLFGVATAGFQVEGGYNGPGEPANNWLAWEQVGRVEPVGRRRRLLGASRGGPRPGGRPRVRQLPAGRRVGPGGARRRTVSTGPPSTATWRSSTACVERGMAPLVTLHHFTHPAWLGEDLWLRPDAAGPVRRRGRGSSSPRSPRRCATGSPSTSSTSWPSMTYVTRRRSPRAGRAAFADAAVALDNLLAAHVLGLRRHPRRATRRRGDHQQLLPHVYEYDRLLVDLLLARSHGVERGDLDDWIAERRRRPLRPAARPRASARRCCAGPAPGSPPTGRPAPGSSAPRRALDALEASPHERTLDVLGIDYYDPLAARHFRLPGHRTAGGRSPLPARELWDDPPDPAGLTRWLGVQHALAPGLPLWVVENGMCNRVRRRPVLRPARRLGPAPVPAGEPGRGGRRRRRRRARRGLLALVAGRQLRVGLLRAALRPLRGRPRPRRARAAAWLETDAMGRDSAGTYRSDHRPDCGPGDRSVLDPGVIRRPVSARPGGTGRPGPARPRPRSGAPGRPAGSRAEMAPTPCPVG